MAHIDHKVVKQMMFDKAFIANPYPHYNRWLQRERIFWSPDFFGGSWVLMRHKDNKVLLVFSSHTIISKNKD